MTDKIILKALAGATVIGLVALSPGAAMAGDHHDPGASMGGDHHGHDSGAAMSGNHHGHESFSAVLDPLNHTPGSGHATVKLHGHEATVSVSYSGLAETFDKGPFPHAQHIHIGGKGRCPDMSRDTDGDGVVSTTEGLDDYGPVGTSLTTEGDTSPESVLAIDRYPGGASADYHRTFTIDKATAKAVRAGNGVIVVHGVDPALLSEEAQQAKSDLDPSLPQAATAPALCGALKGSMPVGGADTGGGHLAQSDGGALTAGGAALAAAGAAIAAVFAWRRRDAGAAAS